MKPIKSLTDELLELVEVAEKEGNFHWQLFEVREDGHLQLDGFGKKPYTYDFYMRVGTHMGQPRQAIMSCGKFIKIRKYGVKEHWKLNTLDPNKPNTCFYYVQPSPYVQYQYAYGGAPTPAANPSGPTYTWDPAKAFPEYLVGGAQIAQWTQLPNINTLGNYAQTLSGLQQAGVQHTGYQTSIPVTFIPTATTAGTVTSPGILGTIGNMLGVTTKI